MELLLNNLRLLFSAAVRAVQPHNLIPSTVKRKGNTLLIHDKRYALNGNCYVAAFGKAAAGMALAVESVIGDHLIHGIVSVPRGIQTLSSVSEAAAAAAASKLEIIEGAAGNLPDSDSVHAAKKILSMVKKLDENALLLVLISGGGSALLPLPKDGLSLEDKLAVIRLLVEKGANIVELNCVRKTLSVVKGGGLAVASYPAKTLTLILSDIIGDPIESIASGPTTPNVNQMTASDVIKKYKLDSAIPCNIHEALSKESNNATNIPVSGGSFCHVDNFLIGSNYLALSAASHEAEELGYVPVIMFSGIQGLAKEAGSHFAQLANFICEAITNDVDKEQCRRVYADLAVSLGARIDKAHDNLFDAILACKKSRQGLCLVFGGETTVEVKGNGVGGRNQELALSFAISVDDTWSETRHGQFYLALLSAGTDGIDGPTPAAGALAYREQIATARSQNMVPEEFLRDNDSHRFFAKLCDGEDLIMSGHTGTNVMDIIILIIQPL